MKFHLGLLLMFLLVSCAPRSNPTLPPDTAITSPPADEVSTKQPNPNPFSPRPGDEALTRSVVYIDETSLVIRESYPPQISLSIRGSLPTLCHELRVGIRSPDRENKIMVDAYSVIDPDAICAEVLEPFEEFIDLGTFPPGHYSVFVNGELAGEFDT